MRVVVGSKNPMKLEVAQAVFNDVFSNEEIEFLTCKAESGVADQPYGIEETKTGAKNRTDSAKELIKDADYYVGLEGGIEIIEEGYWVTAWMCVQNKEGKFGFGRTSAFKLPDKIVELLKDGNELTEASDIVFNAQNSGQKGGAIGFLTDNDVTRADFYVQALRFALIPFTNPELYK